MGRSGFLSRCFTSNCLIQLAIRLCEMDVFEIDVSVNKSFMSGTYIISRKLVRHLNCRNADWGLVMVGNLISKIRE